MKDEEVDWDIYHRIVYDHVNTIVDLQRMTGFSQEMVVASVDRLIRYLLIKEENGQLRPLGIEEMLVSCRVRYSRDLPFMIENGVIKMNREG